MKHSESIASLAAALVGAQVDIKAVDKSATNPHFRSKYATLDSIVAMARPALAKHGLALIASAPSTDGATLNVETMLVHTSGEWLSNEVCIPLGKKDPQGAGAAVTYGRRFGVSALLSLTSEEDDDGNAASQPAKRERTTGTRTVEVRAEGGEARPSSTRNVSQPASTLAKPDEDKVWGGKTLGEHTKDELDEIVRDHKNDPKPSMQALVKAARAVLNNRLLGTGKPAA